MTAAEKIIVQDKRKIRVNEPEPEEIAAETEAAVAEGAPREAAGPTPAEPSPQETIAQLTDQNLRLRAEFENFRKRSQREMDSFRRYANEGLIKEILPQLDNLERALSHFRECREPDAEIEALVTGVELTMKGLLDALARNGVSRVESVGRPFDPAVHEAVMRQPDESAEENTVLIETQAGYLLHDRLLRPALVVVSMRPEN